MRKDRAYRPTVRPSAPHSSNHQNPAHRSRTQLFQSSNHSSDRSSDSYKLRLPRCFLSQILEQPDLAFQDGLKTPKYPRQHRENAQPLQRSLHQYIPSPGQDYDGLIGTRLLVAASLPLSTQLFSDRLVENNPVLVDIFQSLRDNLNHIQVIEDIIDAAIVRQPIKKRYYSFRHYLLCAL